MRVSRSDPSRPDQATPCRQRRPVRHEKRRGRRADQQRLGPGVGAEVDPVERTVRHQGDGRGRGCDRASGGEREHGAVNGVLHDQPTPPPCDRGQKRRHSDQQKRPDEVVLLLHTQRPGVLQRGRHASLGEVIRLLRDEAPVRDPGERRDGVIAQPGDGIGRKHPAGDRDGQHHHDQRGQQALRAAAPESGHIDPAGVVQLVAAAVT